MKVLVRKGVVVVALGFAASFAGRRSAQAEAAHPVFATPEAALAVATSPEAFAHSASESRMIAYSSIPWDTPVSVEKEADPSLLNFSTSFTALPDAPEPAMSSSMSFGQQTAGQAPHYTKYISAGWTADKLSARDKVIVGARDLYSVGNIVAIVASAGYSHISDGQPNYGVNKQAFAKRLGAAAIRETTEGVFTDMVFSPLFHQDPRYYVEGPKYGFFHRSLYAITRPLVTRTDNGNSTVNASLLAGYAASAALTPAYYPQGNRNFRDVASTYGGSIGGAALGFFVSEFTDDLLQAIHLKK